MKLLIEQFRAERLYLHHLVLSLGAALHAGKWSAAGRSADALCALLRSHCAFNRDVLPTLSKLDVLNGAAERAERVKRFANELRTLEPSMLCIVEGATATIANWQAARQVLQAFLAEEAEVIEPHAEGAGADRREAPRVNLGGHVRILTPVPAQGLLRDLSLFGMQLQLRDGAPDVGALLGLRVELPGQKHVVDASAEVRWRGAAGADGTTGYGLRFVDLPPHAGVIIARHVASQLDRP